MAIALVNECLLRALHHIPVLTHTHTPAYTTESNLQSVI